MKQFTVDYRADEVTQAVTINRLGHGIDELRERLDTFGFAIAALHSYKTYDAAMMSLADLLEIGAPIIPRIYRRPDASEYRNAFADITTRGGIDHPGFSVRSAQAMHVDGLLEDAGEIPVSMLYCVQKARSGGRTIVFNAVGAHHRLSIVDPPAAELLEHPGVLRRFSTLTGIVAHRDGPAFVTRDDGSVVGRYSDGPTEKWIAPAGQEQVLVRATEFLRAASRADNEWRVSLTLQPGECLVFRNDRLSHGRESFQDDVNSPRHLVRALYGKVPA